jgi:hypothetical protein
MSAAVAGALMGAMLTTSVMAAENVDGDRMSRSEYNASVKSTKADYKAAMKSCADSPGDERAACRKDARVNRDTALSQAHSRMGPMASRGDSTKHAPMAPDTSSEGVATPREIRNLDSNPTQRDISPNNAPVGSAATTGEGGKTNK